MTQLLLTETHTSANAYATGTDALLKFPDGYEKLLIDCTELNVNSVTVLIQGSNLEAFTNPREIKAATVLDNAGFFITLTDPFLWIRVRVLSTVGAAHGSLQTIISGGK